MSQTMEDIAVFLKNLKFKKKLINGIDEADVWKQLDLLQTEYRKLYEAQETKYKILLQEREDIIYELRAKYNEIRKKTNEDA